MILLAYRNLLLAPMRTALTVMAIASVVAVILLLEGFYSGLLTQLRNVVLNRQADLIVVQAGVTNMTAARSILPQFARRDIEAIDGVGAAYPLTGLSAIYEQDGAHTAISVLVYDDHGGPTNVVEGEATTEPRSVVIDRALSEKYGLEIGSKFVLTGFGFRVSGISSGTAAFFTPFVFIHFDDLIDYYLESGTAADITTFPLVSFLLVELEKNKDPSEIAALIENELPEADVMLPKSLADADESLGRVLFGPAMKLLIGVCYTIGILVTGIITFAAVNSRRRELGVLKALGFSNGFLQSVALLESLVMVFISLPIGVLLAGIISLVIEAMAPLYLVSPIELVPMLRTSIACMAFTMIGSLLPVRIIRNVDPAAVFGT